MTSRKEWSKDQTFHLIALYEQHQMLWDPRHTEHRNREKKIKIYMELGAIFECSTEEIQRKIHNLRNQESKMSQELKKSTKRKKSGNGTDEVETSNWPYFGPLKFLIPVVIENAIKSSHRQASMVFGESMIEVDQVTDCEENEQEYNFKKMQQPKRRSRINDVDEELFKFALKSLKREPDDDEKFGQYVSLELKSLKSNFNKARLKSEIRKIIDRIADEDMYANFSNSSASSTPLPSSPASFQLEVDINNHTPRDISGPHIS